MRDGRGVEDSEAVSKYLLSITVSVIAIFSYCLD